MAGADGEEDGHKQPCDHTPPGTQRLLISRKVPTESDANIRRSLVGIVYGWDYDGI